jgi:hypothetical protein
VHDIVNLEGRGIPAVAVVTEQFRSGAQAQGKALGFDPAIVYVEHPIQDRTVEEMGAIARKALAEILQALTSSSATV